MEEVAGNYLVPLWNEHARAKTSVDIWDNMLDYGSLVAFMAFMGLQQHEVPRDIYITLADMFCYVRQYVQTAFPLPYWTNPRYMLQWRKLCRFIHPLINKQKESETMLGSIVRSHTVRHPFAFEDLKELLQPHVTNQKSIDCIQGWYDAHKDNLDVYNFVKEMITEMTRNHEIEFNLTTNTLQTIIESALCRNGKIDYNKVYEETISNLMDKGTH